MILSSARISLVEWTAPIIAALGAPFYSPKTAAHGSDAPATDYDSDIFIRASQPEIFRVLDPASPDFHEFSRGSTVSQGAPQERRYEIHNHRVPGVLFILFVETYSPDSEIAVRSIIESDQPFGGVEESTGHYRIIPENDGCRVSLAETTVYKNGLGKFARSYHELLMKRARRMDLMLIKAHAETISA